MLCLRQLCLKRPDLKLEPVDLGQRLSGLGLLPLTEALLGPALLPSCHSQGAATDRRYPLRDASADKLGHGAEMLSSATWSKQATVAGV